MGVHTTEVTRDGLLLIVELWYPASDRYAGADSDPGMRDAFSPHPGARTTWQAAVRDAAPKLGAFPLVVFSHEVGGHRRQSTFLCTHLASHGYVVAAADHPGSTTTDMLELARGRQSGESAEPSLRLSDCAAARPAELGAVVDALFGGSARAVTRTLQRERVAMIGHGLGGAGVLAAVRDDPRVIVAVAMAPTGGASEATSLATAVEDGFGRVVPTLVIAADRDGVAPLGGVRDFVSKIRAPTRLAVIKNTDHFHFCDQTERMHELAAELPAPGDANLSPMAELAPADRVYRALRALCLAHLDAFIKTREGAKDSLAHTLAGRTSGHADEAVDVELG